MGLLYSLGAICWICNAWLSGWPLPTTTASADLQVLLLGISSLCGALMFHVGAVLQVNGVIGAARALLVYVMWVIEI